jgi:hypothetical protein
MEGTEIVKKSRPAALMDLWKTLKRFPQAPQGQQQPILAAKGNNELGYLSSKIAA